MIVAQRTKTIPEIAVSDMAATRSSSGCGFRPKLHRAAA
jgi:hypothetical protein